jgi:hypothetical protein
MTDREERACRAGADRGYCLSKRVKVIWVVVAGGLPRTGFWRFFPYRSPVWNRRAILGGYALLLVGFFILVIPYGYGQFPCNHGYGYGPAEPCIYIPNQFLPIGLDCLFLATVPLVCLFDFRGGFRVAGIVAIGGLLFLVLGTFFVWDSTYGWGPQTVSIISTSPPWSPVIKLGGVLVGAGLVLYGCLVKIGNRAGTRTVAPPAASARPAEIPKA